MENYEVVIFFVAIVIVLSAFADKLKLPNPVLLVFAGLIIGITPYLPNLELDSDIVFFIFLPPILFDAAFRTPWLDFKKEIRTISALAISLVFFSTVAVAVAAHYLVPGFEWPIAFVLGAIISPPDAVAATSIIKGLGLKRQLVTVIEGESLVNDASALIAYRYAVTATVTGEFILWKAGLEFLLIAGGGVLIGLIIGYILAFAFKKIEDNTLVETSLTLLTPFISYIVAEKLQVSGILAVVTTGLYLSWRSREVFSFETRLRTAGVWETVVFLLNGIVFVLIGLQLPELVEGLSTITLQKLIGYGILISIITMVIRIVWVFTGAYHNRIFPRKKKGDSEEQIDWKSVLIVAWTGTRGVVSLASALALPFVLKNGDAFPKRHSILLLTFTVIMVTLVVQGLTLPLLIRLLKIKPETLQQQKEVTSLSQSLIESTLKLINSGFNNEFDASTLERLKKQYEFNYQLLVTDEKKRVQKQEIETQLSTVNKYLLAQIEVIKYQRSLLLQYQNEDTYSEEALSKAEHELDIEEMRLNALLGRTEDFTSIVNSPDV